LIALHVIRKMSVKSAVAFVFQILLKTYVL
jgi:hypothetical protein